jgi:hypothetical protein
MAKKNKMNNETWGDHDIDQLNWMADRLATTPDIRIVMEFGRALPGLPPKNQETLSGSAVNAWAAPTSTTNRKRNKPLITLWPTITSKALEEKFDVPSKLLYNAEDWGRGNCLDG